MTPKQAQLRQMTNHLIERDVDGLLDALNNGGDVAAAAAQVAVTADAIAAIAEWRDDAFPSSNHTRRDRDVSTTKSV